MDVVYSSSDAYSEIAGVSIVSLLENNVEEHDINIYIIDNGISETNKKNLSNIVRAYSKNIIFINGFDIEKKINTKINVGRWHISTFYRLFLDSILPKEIEKVIYIDCDTLVLGSLSKIWNMPMDGNYVMGADDCRGSAYRDNIGLEKKQIYINNGFILIDLQSWRDNNIEKLYQDFIKKYNGDITYMDQGVLNGVLGNIHKIGLLPVNYNVQTVFFDFTYKQISTYRRAVWKYSEKEIKNGITDPIIIHFTSCFLSGTRPWNKENNHPFRPSYLQYKAMTPWKNDVLWDDNRKKSKKIMTKMCKMLPISFVVCCISIIHSKIYPFVRNMKNMINMKKIHG